MLNTNFTVTSYDLNSVILNWTAANATDVSYIFINGTVIAGNIEFAQAERFIVVPFKYSNCAVIEIHDFEVPDNSCIPITVPSNKIPILGWEAVSNAVSYNLYANNKKINSILAQNDVLLYKKAIINPYFYGKVWTWHFFTVTAVDLYGNESLVKYFPYFVWDLPPLIKEIAVVNGSMAGKYNFTITL